MRQMAEKSILIIDDDQALVGALKDGLETLGFKVSAAYDGLQGVLQAHQGKPDVIMLDFNMPAGGGPGVYDRLRSSADTARTPIVFLTGMSVDEVKEKIKPTPNTFFLKKPITVAQLQKVLNKITSGTSGTPASKTGGDASAAPPAPAPVGTPPPAPAPSGGGEPVFMTERRAVKPVFAPAPEEGAPPPAAAPAAVSASASPPAFGAGGTAKKVFEYEVRVAYGDADRLGLLYHANHLKLFENGRTDLLRQAGVRLRELERTLFLPVVEARCEYLAPIRYDDLLRVRTWVSWIGPASVTFESEIRDQAGARVLARGLSRLGVLNEFWKPVRIPKELKERLLPYLAA